MPSSSGPLLPAGAVQLREQLKEMGGEVGDLEILYQQQALRAQAREEKAQKLLQKGSSICTESSTGQQCSHCKVYSSGRGKGKKAGKGKQNQEGQQQQDSKQQEDGEKDQGTKRKEQEAAETAAAAKDDGEQEDEDGETPDDSKPARNSKKPKKEAGTFVQHK